MSAAAAVSIALEASGLSLGYHRHPVVTELDLAVPAGQVAAVLGPNGAGKTTTLLGLAGELRPLAGTLAIKGRPAPRGLHACARSGVAFVPEERGIFRALTVRENLKVGRCEPEQATALFPELEPLMQRKAGTLSGGEQQMLAIGRALARNAEVLLVDEMSLGLAPLVVQRILDAVRDAATSLGVAVVLVEQHVRQVLRVADEVIVLRRGTVALRGSGEEMRGRASEIEAAYLGAATARP